MMRTLLVLGVLGGITFAVVSWATGGADGLSKEKRGDRTAGPAQKTPDATPPVADAGQKASPAESSVNSRFSKAEAVRVKDAVGLMDLLTVDEMRINSIKRQEVSAPRPGQILVLGTELDPTTRTKEEMARLEAEEKVTKVTMGFLVMEATEADRLRRVPVYRIKGDKRFGALDERRRPARAEPNEDCLRGEAFPASPKGDTDPRGATSRTGGSGSRQRRDGHQDRQAQCQRRRTPLQQEDEGGVSQ